MPATRRCERTMRSASARLAPSCGQRTPRRGRASARAHCTAEGAADFGPSVTRMHARVRACSSSPSGAPESSPRDAMAVPAVMSRTQALSRADGSSTRRAYSTPSVIAGVSVLRIWHVATDRCTYAALPRPSVSAESVAIGKALRTKKRSVVTGC
eukprot:4113197-Prymnesium_polylepis.2